MADSDQTYKNHVRFLPPFHFFVLPVFLINFLRWCWLLYRSPQAVILWETIVAAALFMTALLARVMALTVQDRVIRLEMRVRLDEVLPPDLRARIGELTREQCVGLRFASDAELAGLVKRALAGELKSRSDIKKQIVNWQGDYLRA